MRAACLLFAVALGGCTIIFGDPIADHACDAGCDASDLAGTLPLTVALTGDGSGTVTSSPTGITCSGDSCAGNFAIGTTVTLTAAGAIGSRPSWSEGCTNTTDEGTTTCSITIGAATDLTLTFELVSEPVHIDWLGSGDGTVTLQPGGATCHGYCDVLVPYGATITLTATPAPGASFVGFQAGSLCSGPGACSLGTVIDTSSLIQATFVDDAGLLATATYGTPGVNHVRAVTSDASGNFLVTGCYSGTVDLGGSDLVAATAREIFVAKLSPTGAHIWSKRYASDDLGAAFSPCGTRIATDSAGNVYLGGFFANSLALGSGTLTSAHSAAPFVAKLDSAGNDVWGKVMPVSAALLADAVLAVDGAGNVFVFGSMDDSADLGGGARAGGYYLVKYDTTGAHVWSKGMLADNQMYSASLATDGSGNVILAGSFSGTASFGGSSFTSAGDQDWVLARYAAGNGNHQWSRSFGSTAEETATSVVAAADGILVGGHLSFGTTADLGGGPVTIAASTASASPLLLAKYTLEGDYVWGKIIGDDAYIYALALDAADDVYMLGSSQGELDLGDGVGHAGLSFIAKLGPAGAPLWARHSDATLYGLAATPSAVVVGGEITEGQYVGTTQYHSTGSDLADMQLLLARFSP